MSFVLRLLGLKTRNPKFAMVFRYGEISVFHRTAGGRWVIFDTLEAEDPRMALRMGMLRRKARALGAGRQETVLVIPENEITFMSQRMPVAWFMRRKRVARRLLKARAHRNPNSHTFDFAVQGKTLNVAATNINVIRQCVDYASSNGFRPCGVIAFPVEGPFATAINFKIPGKRCILCRSCSVAPEYIHMLDRKLPESRALPN